jgi:hypothetical protein
MVFDASAESPTNINCDFWITYSNTNPTAPITGIAKSVPSVEAPADSFENVFATLPPRIRSWFIECAEYE